MKLITLNIWGGIVYEPLIAFLRKHAKRVDIFCLQEVFNNPPDVPSKVQTKNPKLSIYSDIRTILSQFDSYLHPTQDNEESLAMFIRKSIPIDKIDEVFVYRWKNAMENNDPSTYGINVEYLQFHQDGKKYTIGNLHGHWTPSYKGDNPARLEQAQNIRKFLDDIEGARILCGDFNLDPDTESMRTLETGMRNLIKEHGITSTRTHYYSTQRSTFADYVLVSPEVEVDDFLVLQEIVSDHLPLYLDFS